MFHVGFSSASQLILGQIALTPEVENDAEYHSDTGRLKAVSPAVHLTQCSADEGSDECSQVHSHVIDREGAVAARVALRIQTPHLRRQIRFETAVSQNE